MITPPRTKVKSENSAISFYITRSQKLILIAPPNQIFPQLTSQTIRGMGMESHSSRIVFPIEKYFPWPKHGIQRSRSLSITFLWRSRIFLSFEKFLSIEHFSSAENFLSMENFFIDREFIKTIQSFIIDREYIFLLESVLVNSLFWRHYTTDKI